jgi:hypothetical protein
MFVPDEEWTQKYGKLKDQKVTYKNGSELQIKDHKITISAKTDADMIALTKEGNKILEGIMKNINDVEGHKIDKMEQIALHKVQMEAESRKIMLDAAMRLPVRCGLEESYNMVNDELIKQGEARRLGGTLPQQQQVELTDKSLKPILDRLDKMFQKLEDKLQTGVPVKVS